MRLKKRSEILRVFREGVVWRGRCFSVHGLFRTPDASHRPPGYCRLGIVVTRKVGSAVERNRIKRRIREVFRGVAQRLPTADLIVVSTRECLDAPVEELEKDLLRAASKLVRRTKEKT
jgi:ribonuclease P protein component